MVRTNSNTQMRILLRRAGSREFYGMDGIWTPDIHLAVGFGSSTELLQHATRLGMNGVEIVFAFADPGYNMAVLVAA